MEDAQIDYNQVQCAIAGYNYGEPTCGQRAVYELGLTGIPVVNVNNNCSTGSTALFLARNLVLSGAFDCVMAVGFEKMLSGLSQHYTDAGYTSPVARHFDHMFACGSSTKQLKKMNPMTANVIKMFGDAADEHSRLYGTSADSYAYISYKNHKHSKNNPYAQNQKEYSLAAIKNPAMKLYGPLTLFQACPTGDGAAAAIVCSEAFVKKHQLYNNAVEILSQRMVTDLPSSFDKEKRSFIDLCGYQMSKKGAEHVFRESGLSPNDVNVLEVHDCFSSNELMVMEAMGLCREGEGGRLVDTGKWIKNSKGGELFQVGGQWVVNASGGLESKGHPIGATGLAQCFELCLQLRNKAGKRQVPNAKVGLQHNFGLGSAAVITLYRKASFPASL